MKGAVAERIAACSEALPGAAVAEQRGTEESAVAEAGAFETVARGKLSMQGPESK